MDQSPIEIDGLDLILKQFDRIGAPKEEIKATNKQIGQLVINKAKTYVPVVSGRLLKSLRAAALQNRVVIRGGSRAVPYANPIHWGWFYDRNNFIYKNIMPNPFLTEALDYNRNEIFNKYATEMQQLIDKYTPPPPKRK
jgi:hypothetical protein